MKLVRRLLGDIDHPVLRVVGSIVLAALASGASVALMAVSAWLLSRAAEHPPVMYLGVAVVGVRFFGVSRGVFRYLERLVSHNLGLRMQSALRLITYQRLAQTTLLGRRRGDLLTRVVADVEAILDLVVRVAIPFLSGGIVIAGTSVVIGIYNWPSALFLFASAIVAAVLAPWLARRLSAQANASAVPARGRLADQVRQIARTAPDLVAYGIDDKALAELIAVDEELRQAEARSAVVRGVAIAIQVLAMGVAVIGALAVGSQAVAAGTLAPVMLAVVVLTPLALHEVFNDFAKAAQAWTRATVALARVEAVVNAPTVGIGDRPDTEAVADPGVELRNVTVGWPGYEPLLSGLNVSVRSGERVALTGRSGIGKTTIAATILGLIPPVAGEVVTRGRLGYLAQDAHIFATSVAENVRIGRRDASDEQIAEALTRAGLPVEPDRLVSEFGGTVSGGEARRLAAARIFVGDFQVLVLDEPSEHLDADTATAVLDDLWAQTEGLPMLVITHDPAVVARCDRVIELDRM